MPPKKNRLAKTRGYLCGAIEFVEDAGIGWRQKLKEDLYLMDIVWLDPTKKPTEDGCESKEEVARGHQLMKERHYDEAAKMFRLIRCIDLRMVDICDFMIVLLDLDIHHCGTYEELFWANRMLKPILVVVKQGKSRTPSWLMGTIPHRMIFSTMHELQAYLKYIAYTEKEEFDPLNNSSYKRWRFFNFRSSLENIGLNKKG